MAKVYFRIHLEVILSFSNFYLLTKECVPLSQRGLDSSPFMKCFYYDKQHNRQEKEAKEPN